jgi:DNA-binding GntR family transcriptional regulator
MLQSEGLIVVLPNAGARVPKLDREELDELYWVREHVEPAALERSARDLTEEHFAAMQEDIEIMDRGEGRSRDEAAALLKVDRRFHLTALSGGKSDRILQHIQGLWNLAEPYRVVFLQLIDEEEMQIMQTEHRLILDALRRGSGEDAAQLLSVHIRRTRLALAANPQIFDQ